jgi:hypothetical protein
VHSALNGEPTAAATQSGGNMEVHALLADGSGGSRLFGRTAENVAVTPLFDAVRNQIDGSVRVRSITVPSAPAALTSLWSPFGVRAPRTVTGAWIDDRLVVLDLGAQPVRIRLPGPGPWTVTVHTAPPSTRPAFHPTDRVTETSTRATGSVVLPAYAEVVVTPG